MVNSNDRLYWMNDKDNSSIKATMQKNRFIENVHRWFSAIISNRNYTSMPTSKWMSNISMRSYLWYTQYTHIKYSITISIHISQMIILPESILIIDTKTASVFLALFLRLQKFIHTELSITRYQAKTNRGEWRLIIERLSMIISNFNSATIHMINIYNNYIPQ